MMEFEADRMTGLVLTDEVVLPERNVMLEERNQRVDNNPGCASWASRWQAALYLNHPYGRPVIGWRHEIEKLDRKDALDFYKRFYTPEQRGARGRGRRHRRRGQGAGRGNLRQDRAARRDRPAHAPAGAGAALACAASPSPIRASTQPSLQRSYLVPSFATGKPGEAEALEVLSHILGARLQQPALHASW